MTDDLTDAIICAKKIVKEDGWHELLVESFLGDKLTWVKPLVYVFIKAAGDGNKFTSTEWSSDFHLTSSISSSIAVWMCSEPGISMGSRGLGSQNYFAITFHIKMLQTMKRGLSSRVNSESIIEDSIPEEKTQAGSKFG